MTAPFEEMYVALKHRFFDERVLGANPRVFHYQWHDGYIDGKGRKKRIIAMRFFDGIGVYAWGAPP